MSNQSHEQSDGSSEPHAQSNDQPDSVETLHEGRHLRLVSDGGWEYVQRIRCNGIVAIVAITETDEQGHGPCIILVEQLRPAVHARVIELPAGLVGDEPGKQDEASETAAHRELEEETGFSAERMTRLASGPQSSGASAEVIEIFLAEGLRRVSSGGGVGGEEIDVHLVPLEGFRDWTRRKEEQGFMVDPKIYAGLHLASLQSS